MLLGVLPHGLPAHGARGSSLGPGPVLRAAAVLARVPVMSTLEALPTALGVASSHF